jgi:hypothetical protein
LAAATEPKALPQGQMSEAERAEMLKVRTSAHRDQPDRSIVITRIGRS